MRGLVVLVIALLVVYQVGAWIYLAFGLAAGIVSATLVASVSFFSSRMARSGGGRTAWFLIPTLLFTVVPLGAKIWTFVTESGSLWDRMIELVPFIVGFAAPVFLLLVVYVGLRNRADAG
ncbi:MAG: hypothetical protein ABI654_12420 [Betaproteobacteria bacterium]